MNTTWDKIIQYIYTALHSPRKLYTLQEKSEKENEEYIRTDTIC